MRIVGEWGDIFRGVRYLIIGMCLLYVPFVGYGAVMMSLANAIAGSIHRNSSWSITSMAIWSIAILLLGGMLRVRMGFIFGVCFPQPDFEL